MNDNTIIHQFLKNGSSSLWVLQDVQLWNTFYWVDTEECWWLRILSWYEQFKFLAKWMKYIFFISTLYLSNNIKYNVFVWNNLICLLCPNYKRFCTSHILHSIERTQNQSKWHLKLKALEHDMLNKYYSLLGEVPHSCFFLMFAK